MAADCEMSAKVLVVEEKTSIGRMLRFVLEAAGYGVVEAPDGWEAIRKLRATSCDLALCDLEILKKGLDLLKAVKETDPHCSVVVMTAYGDIASATQALREGAQHFLTRPVDPDHLLHVVKQVLESRPSRGSTAA